MSLKISIPIEKDLSPKIAVFGVGGGGVNAVNNMISSNLEGVDFFVANTDAQALDNSLATNKIKFGITSTKGLGAGSDPKVGAIAAEESTNEIIEALDRYNLIFITAGMGGGTGTGGAPIVAKIAKERNILTVGVVTKPFHFEGARRMKTAEEGLDELQKFVDTLIIIPNQNLFRLANEKTTFADAFKMADEVLHAGVKGITDLITKPGLINLDFADIHAVMNEKGKAMMGTGEAEGENRAIKASEAAISNPLLDHSSMKGARGVLINITGGMDMTLFEVDEAANRIKEEVDPNANIIFGSAFDADLEGKLRVSVVATGIDVKTQKIIDNKLINNFGDITLSKSISIDSITERNAIKENDVKEGQIEEKIIEKEILAETKEEFINKNFNEDKLSFHAQKKEVLEPKQNSFYFTLTNNNRDDIDHIQQKEKVRDHDLSTVEDDLAKEEPKKIKSTSSIFEIPTFLRNKKD
jgi:cell division protein FtsZ